MSERLKMSQTAYSDIENNKTKVNLVRLQEIAVIFDMDINDLISFDEGQIFHNTFNQNAKGFFKVKKFFNESFENERQSYQDQISTLKEEITYLRKKLDEKTYKKGSKKFEPFLYELKLIYSIINFLVSVSPDSVIFTT